MVVFAAYSVRLSRPMCPARQAGHAAFRRSSCDDITVEDIATGYRKPKTLEKNITDVLESLALLGHVATRDDKTFEIRRMM